jgi:hypothetical protein
MFTVAGVQVSKGEQVTVTMVDGTIRTGMFQDKCGLHIRVESQAGQCGSLMLVQGIKTLVNHGVPSGPCGQFTGTARRCTTCGMLAKVH